MRIIYLISFIGFFCITSSAQSIEIGGDIQFKKLNDSSFHNLNFEISLRVYRLDNLIDSLPDTAYVCVQATCPNQTQILILQKEPHPLAQAHGGFFDSNMHYCPTYDSIPLIITHLYKGKLYLDSMCTQLNFTYISSYQRFRTDNIISGDSSHIKINATLRPHLFHLENKGIEISPAPYSFCINRKQRYLFRNHDLNNMDSTHFFWNQPQDNTPTDSCNAQGVGLLYAQGFSSTQAFPSQVPVVVNKDTWQFSSQAQKGAFRYKGTYQDVLLYDSVFSGWFLINSVQREGVVFMVEGCAPLADFKYNYLQIGDTTRVRFVADTTDVIVGNSFFWDFGNGQSDTGKVVESDFTKSHHYPVRLKVCNDCGCDSVVIPVLVARIPIQEIKKTTLLIYPNPTSDLLNIHGLNWKGKTIDIQIFDMNAKLVYQEKQFLEENDFTINVKSFPMGAYTLFIKTSHEYLYEKIWIQR